MPTETPSRWTAAVYLAGGENVTREMIPALHDLRDAGLANREVLSTLAQFEPGSKPPRLFVFDEALLPELALSPKSRRHAPTPMGLANYEHLIALPDDKREAGLSRELLKRFVTTARAASREGRLLMVISGHANGAVGEFLGCRAGRDPLDLRELATAFSAEGTGARKVDILGMDCCHMSMVEVAYELLPHARFLVASEGSILNHGWPYREILEAMVELPPREAAAEIARQYVGTYSDYSLLGVDADCAVTDLDALPLLTAPMRRLSELLTVAVDDADVWRPTVLAHWEAQSYKDEEYVDLADFCDRLRLHIGDDAIQECCSEVIESVGRIVGTTCVSGSGFQFSTGLSIYFPWCNDAVKSKGENGVSELSKYQELAFNRETLWGTFLDAYLSATRREPRRATAARSPYASEPAARKETIPLEPAVDSQPMSNEEEMMMEIKRYPPWNGKGGPVRSSVKNHPRSDATEKGSIPTRRYPPWNGKGPLAGTSRLKNHPRNQNS